MTTTFLSEVQAVVDVSVRSELALESIHTYVVLSDVSTVLEIVPSVFADSLFVRRTTPSDSDVDDDVFVIINYLHALIDCRIKVQIPHSAAVHEHVAVPMPWLERARNRA